MTEKKTGIIVFGEDWGQHPSSTQHLISHVMCHYPVIWVNSIGLRSPKMTFHDLNRAANKLFKFLTPGKSTTKTIKQGGGHPIALVNPITLPFYGNPIARMINKFLLSRQIKTQIQKHNLKRVILWLSLPSAADMIGSCGEIATMYYAGDDFSALEGVDHGPITKMEKKIARQADAIIIPGANLAHKFDPHRSFIIEHGCDLELFSEPKLRASDVNWNIPTAGFYGSLDEWLDQDLICQFADRNPDWRVLLIGPQKTDITNLLNCPNITYLGPKPHHELPRYSQHWDLSLLPFKNTPQIKACNPLKLREYLAAGRPVAATYFDAAAKYKHVIDICSSPEDFERSMITALNQPISERDTRIKAVAQSDWKDRSREIMLLLDALQNEAVTQNKTSSQLPEEHFA